MAKELASVKETIDLSPQEVLDRAQPFLTEQGYSVVHRMFTSLTVERYLPSSAGEQEKRTITIVVLPQKEGGVQIKVLGDDIEGVQESQAEWVEWSESLPKRNPKGQQTESTSALNQEEEGVLAEAKGTDYLIEVLRDKVNMRSRPLSDDVKEIPIRQIASVTLKAGWPLGYIVFVLGGQDPVKEGRWSSSSFETGTWFTNKQKESFEAVKRTVEQLIEEREAPAEVPSQPQQEASLQAPVSTPAAFNTVSASSPTSAKPTSRVAGGPEILNKKLRKLAEQHKDEDESIEFCLISTHVVGGWHQAIVALAERLLVIKPGMVAGATFGARVTSFYYRDITGIEVNTGLMSGVIEINTPSYQGTAQKDFWNVKDENKNPFRVTNCLPVDRFELKEYKPYLDRLRKMIRDAKQGNIAPQPPQSGGSLSSELEKLASLRTSGILTDEEFQQAKRRLLG